ncbi:pyridoxal phosphate-dependent aminotransferase [Actinomadura atramentaria]|uniref:pyridoxal phosphate-dependent aminotransferase n=1 Tax=Actinomadura atramentaria TaxID=1990 RepID=UPI00037F73DC|nr:aminotransferase class I/II-fold pyridoxal phosphate-dependent enzyme [Actinomadura atramentaria]
MAHPRGRPVVSPNLLLDQHVRERVAAGQDVLHLGFGESRLPPPRVLVDRLAAGAVHQDYGPVAGRPVVRAEAAGYFARRGLPTAPDQVLLGPGAKALLLAVLAAVPGDVVLPTPCWVTYAPQTRLLGRRAVRVRAPEGCGGVPDPDGLARAVPAARAAGADPRLLVLTLPDNPTGALAPPGLVRDVCAVAARFGLLVVSDEIYRDLLHDPAAAVLSPAEALPERTVVLTGLSKSLSLGGWRVGVVRFPDGSGGRTLRERVTALASESWSALAGPQQEVARVAFAEPPEVRDHVRASARLHGAVTAAVASLFRAAGARCPEPGGGFYLYPDLEALRPVLASRGVVDSPSLQRMLLDDFGVAVLGGHNFGDDPGALRFRAATSLLHGATPKERRAVLRAADPVAAPPVARALTRLRAVLGELASPSCGAAWVRGAR